MALPETCLEDIFRCVSYLMVMPSFMICGIIGCIATIFVLTGARFRTNTFFYLKVLSVSDLMYLITAFGYIYEIFFLQSYSSLDHVTQVRF